MLQRVAAPSYNTLTLFLLTAASTHVLHSVGRSFVACITGGPSDRIRYGVRCGLWNAMILSFLGPCTSRWELFRRLLLGEENAWLL